AGPRQRHRDRLDRAHRPRPRAGGRPPRLHGHRPGHRGRRAPRGPGRRGGHRRVPGEVMSLLEIEGLTSRHGLLTAVREVGFRVAEGEVVALIGANGAGKTTLLRTVAGAHTPSEGTISYAGENLAGVPAHERVKRGIALVPEGRRLFPELTVEENLLVA